MASLDIVKLIEKSPINKLSSENNYKLISKIQKNFTETQQQLFISSFYCYLNHNQTNDFVIDLDNIWKWMGFSQKVNLQKILHKFFKADIDYKILLCQLAKQKKTNIIETNSTNKQKGSGGHNKATIMITIKTFKLLCIKAGTKKSNEIHEYFIKLEEMMHEIIEEESEELKLQLQVSQTKLLQSQTDITELEEKKKQEYEKKLHQEKVLEKQNILLGEYGTIGAIVYIIRVKSLDKGKYIIKIGESRRGVLGRYNEHKSKYEECLLLDCFSVIRSKDFENFLHNHESIRYNKVKDLQNHEKENELFLIGKNLSYAMITNIIANNINNYNDSHNEIHKLELENEKMRLMIEANEKGINKGDTDILFLIKELVKRQNTMDNTLNEILSKINQNQTKTSTNFNEQLVILGPRLQKINPETLELIHVYECVSECMKENNKLKRPSINKAIEENTIYKGFRWLFVDRELDPNVITNIEPTKKTKVQNTGYIAKLNPTKTEILDVYLDRKTASNLNGYGSSSALDIPVKKFTITRGHYYKLFENCDVNLIEEFIEKNGNPILYKCGVGQFNENMQLVKEFACKYDCIKALKMSDKTLAKIIDMNKPYNNFSYRHLENKLSCF